MHLGRAASPADLLKELLEEGSPSGASLLWYQYLGYLLEQGSTSDLLEEGITLPKYYPHPSGEMWVVPRESSAPSGSPRGASRTLHCVAGIPLYGFLGLEEEEYLGIRFGVWSKGNTLVRRLRFRVRGVRLGVRGLVFGVRVQGSGFRVGGSGLRV